MEGDGGEAAEGQGGEGGAPEDGRGGAALKHRATPKRADAEAGKRPRGRGRRGDAEARDSAERKTPEDTPTQTQMEPGCAGKGGANAPRNDKKG